MLNELVQKIATSRKTIGNKEALEIVNAMATLKDSPEGASQETEQPQEQPEELAVQEEAVVETTSKSEETPEDPKKQDVETDVWQKRYSDLRREVEKNLRPQLEEARKKAQEAEKALKSGATKYVKAEDLARFEEEYGDLAPVVKELAFKEAAKLVEDHIQAIEAKRNAEEAEKAEKQKYISEAQRAVAAKHSDWKEIGESTLFQTWLSQQLEVTKRLAADSDPESVILVLDMYKKDTGYAAKKTAEVKKLKSEEVKVTKEQVKPKESIYFDAAALKKGIEEAQRRGDYDKLGKLLEQFDKLNKKGN